MSTVVTATVEHCGDGSPVGFLFEARQQWSTVEVRHARVPHTVSASLSLVARASSCILPAAACYQLSTLADGLCSTFHQIFIVLHGLNLLC